MMRIEYSHLEDQRAFAARANEGEKGLIVEAIAYGTKPSLKVRLGVAGQAVWAEGGKQMEGGIMAQLQDYDYKKQSFIDSTS